MMPNARDRPSASRARAAWVRFLEDPLSSPHTFELLRTRLAWTVDDHRAWLEDTLIDLLLADAPPR